MRKRLYTMATLAMLTIAFQASTVSATFTFNAGAPLYGQETSTWCGPATGQMILSESGVSKTQTEIWNKIQLHKKDTGFYTDPDGLSLTLTDFDVHPWRVVSMTTQDAIIEFIMEEMVRDDDPVALLVDAGNHWVVWNGFTTDINPLTGDATLQQAILNDPLPVTSGHVETLTAAAFKSRFSLNTYGTIYLNKYVAVIPEPATLVLLGIGSLLMLRRRRCSK